MPRRASRLILAVWLAAGAAAGGAAPGVAADDGTPPIDARVRVQVSGLWPGWHMGMFNQVSSLFDGRTRAEPADPDEWTYAGETWRDVSMVALRESERRCPVPDR